MRDHKAKVIKAGNSYALRISKQVAEDAQLQVGEVISLPILSKKKGYNANAFWKAASNLANDKEKTPALNSIEDVIKWQREVRQDRALPGRD